MKKLLLLPICLFSFIYLSAQEKGEARNPEIGLQAGQKSLSIFAGLSGGKFGSGEGASLMAPQIAYLSRNQKLNQHRLEGGFAFGAAEGSGFGLLTSGYEYQWFWRGKETKRVQPYFGFGSGLEYRYDLNTYRNFGRAHDHKITLKPRITAGMEVHVSKKCFLDFAIPVNLLACEQNFRNSAAPTSYLDFPGSLVNFRFGLGLSI